MKKMHFICMNDENACECDIDRLASEKGQTTVT